MSLPEVWGCGCVLCWCSVTAGVLRSLGCKKGRQSLIEGHVI
jgi:hypothetical protein